MISTEQPCAACGGRAALIVLLDPGEIDPRTAAVSPPGLESVNRGQHRLSIDAGRLSVTIWTASVPRIGPIVERGDMADLYRVDREFAPVWCPQCAACYCADDWQILDVWDESFYDYTEGDMPAETSADPVGLRLETDDNPAADDP